jgi:hypothetical protein
MVTAPAMFSSVTIVLAVPSFKVVAETDHRRAGARR